LVGVFDLFPKLGGVKDDDGLEVSNAQKAFILKRRTEGAPAADICRKAGISRATYFKWSDGLPA
jgi:DNA invertase Pin-like site-specific DNA recombinase